MLRKVKLKVCGMRDTANIKELATLEPDFMGFIFYPKSPRFAGEVLDADFLRSLPESINKVGVFVNEDAAKVKAIMQQFNLQYAQLHGTESPDYCRELQRDGVKIIKAFAVDNHFDFDYIESFTPYCEYFLLDTKTENHGGSGKKFDWNLLVNYKSAKPFLLGGGVGPDNFKEALKLEQPGLLALDVNSRFELSPGNKNITSLLDLKEAIKHK